MPPRTSKQDREHFWSSSTKKWAWLNRQIQFHCLVSSQSECKLKLIHYISANILSCYWRMLVLISIKYSLSIYVLRRSRFEEIPRHQLDPNWFRTIKITSFVWRNMFWLEPSATIWKDSSVTLQTHDNRRVLACFSTETISRPSHMLSHSLDNSRSSLKNVGLPCRHHDEHNEHFEKALKRKFN